MKQAILKIMTGAVVTVGFLGASAASAQIMAPITYSGSFTGSRSGNTLTTDYTITTDGTIGLLSESNIRAFTVNFIYNGLPDSVNSFTSSTAGAGVGISAGSTTASLNSLSFDFSSLSGNNYLQLYTGDDNQLFFINFNRNSNISPVNTYEGAANGTSVDYRTYVPRASQVIASVVPVINPVAAVPEPATWSMMIVGLGAVGYAMRRRQKVTTRVAFA